MNTYTEYTIGTYALPAIFYADSSGICDIDDRAITAWLDSLPENHTIEVLKDSEDEFKQDEISGAMGDTVRVRVHVIQ